MAANVYSVSLKKETRRCSTILCLALCLLSLVWMNSAAQAGLQAAIQVNSTLDEADASPGDGTCASAPSGLCTLRAALQEANATPGSDTILLPAGTYNLTIPGRSEDLAATGDLDILQSLTVQGAGLATTVVDAKTLDRVLQVFSPAVVNLADLTIQGGDSGAGLGTSGGGIAVASGSQLTLEDVHLLQNSSGDHGGGIYNNGGTVVLRRVRVAGNNAANAAGIRTAGSLSLYNSTVADNHATQTGGGILNTGALTLERVTISSNIADTNGGGLYLHSSDPLTEEVNITNTTISGNQAKAFMGGGIWVYYQTELWIINSTLAGNSAGQGGGIYNYHQQDFLESDLLKLSESAQLGNVHLLNTLVANNTFANCGRSTQTEPIHSLGHNLDSGTSCEFIPAQGDLVSTNPQLGPLQNNGGQTMTHALLSGSPAIDNGSNTNCPAIDQRGVPRPQGASCDIGAYELQPGVTGDNWQYLPFLVR